MAERTKRWMALAMRRLMERSPIDKISVTDICREAEISRPTFYYHFKDKYELAVWTLYLPSQETDYLSLESVAASMEQMRENFNFYRRAYEVNSQSPYWSYRLEFLVKRILDEVREATGDNEVDPRLVFCIRLYCHGALNMAKEWLMSENPEPAIVVARTLFDSMPQILHQALFAEDGTPKRGMPSAPSRHGSPAGDPLA